MITCWHRSDETPAEHGEYLTLTKSMTSDKKFFYRLMFYGRYQTDFGKMKVGWFWYDSEYGDVPSDIEYWMELPEVPQERKE